VPLALLLLLLLVPFTTTTNNCASCACYASIPPIPPFLSVAAKIAVAYSVYSIAVDRHASKTIEAMMKAPSPFDLLENMKNHTMNDPNCSSSSSSSSIAPIDKLRRTISKVTNMVERPQDITL
jgi:hypothetical protein